MTDKNTAILYRSASPLFVDAVPSDGPKVRRFTLLKQVMSAGVMASGVAKGHLSAGYAGPTDTKIPRQHLQMLVMSYQAKGHAIVMLGILRCQ